MTDPMQERSGDLLIDFVAWIHSGDQSSMQGDKWLWLRKDELMAKAEEMLVVRRTEPKPQEPPPCYRSDESIEEPSEPEPSDDEAIEGWIGSAANCYSSGQIAATIDEAVVIMRRLHRERDEARERLAAVANRIVELHRRAVIEGDPR